MSVRLWRWSLDSAGRKGAVSYEEEENTSDILAVASSERHGGDFPVFDFAGHSKKVVVAGQAAALVRFTILLCCLSSWSSSPVVPVVRVSRQGHQTGPPFLRPRLCCVATATGSHSSVSGWPARRDRETSPASRPTDRPTAVTTVITSTTATTDKSFFILHCRFFTVVVTLTEVAETRWLDTAVVLSAGQWSTVEWPVWSADSLY
ncbi:unnamed protein product [Soboliphyme baturini]|uniref:Uncharacterized protein n=1 Tax=Soboliphyme baturini TaxID=241478 RepID=A0A183IJ14_9BILA|nr:unnamed protein product [Soboliphyme baturini]